METSAAVEGRRIEVRGTVQGVGFRPWVYRLAVEEGLSRPGAQRRPGGHDRGLRSPSRPSRPSCGVSGPRRRPPPSSGRSARSASRRRVSPAFAIVPSEGEGARRVSIPPDLATCPECLREVFDPADRRHRYPFTNCTHCGPRYTIARDVPYDRPATTMAGFAMCAGVPARVRGPARPAVPRAADRLPGLRPARAASGPVRRARRRRCRGEPVGEGRDAIGSAARALRRGADRGGEGPGRLPPRVRRDVARGRPAPPRAQEAGREAVRGHGPRPSPPRGPWPSSSPPRSVCSTRSSGPSSSSGSAPAVGLAPEVAPGNPLVGLILAYTPLHHLLLEAAGRPLVMTSGNLSEEPMAAKDGEALERLVRHRRPLPVPRPRDREPLRRLGRPRDRGAAHGLPPLARLRAAAGAPAPARARGPFSRAAPTSRTRSASPPATRPGSDRTSATSTTSRPLAPSRSRWSGCSASSESVPEVIAHDLHPDYASTRYALRRPEPVKVAVQHHHAHVASAMGEHGLAGPVLGLAWDGTGYGTDGTAWGGELLLVDDGAFERLATLRPLRLAGSDEAIRQVWRIALAALDDAFDGAPPLERLRLFDVRAGPRRGRRPADGREGAPLAARARRGPLLRRARRARPRAAAGHATRARWPSSGTSPPTRPRRGAIPST